MLHANCKDFSFLSLHKSFREKVMAAVNQSSKVPNWIKSGVIAGVVLAIVLGAFADHMQIWANEHDISGIKASNQTMPERMSAVESQLKSMNETLKNNTDAQTNLTNLLLSGSVKPAKDKNNGN